MLLFFLRCGWVNGVDDLGGGKRGGGGGGARGGAVGREPLAEGLESRGVGRGRGKSSAVVQ